MSDYIAFYCEKAPKKGTGQTTLANAEKVTESLKQKPLWKRFKNKNLTYTSRHPPKGHFINRIDKTHKTWYELFQIDTKENPKEAQQTAERISKKRNFDYYWDGNWYIKKTEAPATREHPNKKGVQLWMNQIHFSKLTPGLVGYELYWLVRFIYMLPRTWRSDVSFSDGSAVSTADTYCDWDEGGVLILDNKLTMHGRNSSNPKEGKRRIYTVLCSKKK